MAENNSPVAATEETVAPVENSQPEAPPSASATAPEPTSPEPAPAASTPAPSPAAPNARLNGDLGPDLSIVSTDEPHKEVEGGRSYEITYIVVANNPEALESAQKGVKALIDEAGGAVDNTRVSEVRRLSYPIAKRTEGIYVVVNARFEKELTEALERFFKLDENVLRHIILRVEA